MRNWKKIAIIIGIIIIVIVAIILGVFYFFKSSEPVNNNQNIQVQELIISDNSNNSNSSIGGSQNTSNIESSIEKETNNNSPENQNENTSISVPNTQDTNITEEPPQEQPPDILDSSEGKGSTKLNISENMDMDKASVLATQFIEAYTTYNTITLADDTWRTNLYPFLDDTFYDNVKGTEFYTRIHDREWSYNCSTYPEYFSNFSFISTITASADFDPNSRQAVPAVVVTSTKDTTVNTPNAGETWKKPAQVVEQYRIAFNGDISKIINVVKVSEKYYTN